MYYTDNIDFDAKNTIALYTAVSNMNDNLVVKKQVSQAKIQSKLQLLVEKIKHQM